MTTFDWAAPQSGLERYVRRIEGYTQIGTEAVVRRKSPSSEIPLIFVLGTEFALLESRTDAALRPLRQSFVAGLQGEATSIGSTAGMICLQVDLTPIGAWKVLGIDMSELAGDIVDLRAILGPDADELERRLIDTEDWTTRFRLVEEFIRYRIDAAPDEHFLSAAGLSAIARSDGNIRIGDLAAALGCSRKHLGSLFKRQIGMTPKSYARVVRFERALARYETGEIASLSELAAACGYADQSHFNRDCRAFTGLTPPSALMHAGAR